LSNDVIMFKPKGGMCPDDWKKPDNPTWYELRTTLDTLQECYANAERQLANARGIQSQIDLQMRIKKLDAMRMILMEYLAPD